MGPVSVSYHFKVADVFFLECERFTDLVEFRISLTKILLKANE